jgi:hypothetical protein
LNDVEGLYSIINSNLGIQDKAEWIMKSDVFFWIIAETLGSVVISITIVISHNWARAYFQNKD